MTNRVLCLRPQADFARVNALPPASLSVTYHGPADAQVPDLIKQSDALVIPAIGPKLAAELFEGAPVRIVQVTGAGVDRLDPAAMMRLGIPVCNVAGGSNGAVAEYVVAAASTLLRRMAWADAQIKAGNYAPFRARMIADNLAGIDGLRVGIVGFGTIGRVVAKTFHQMGCTICYFDPAAAQDSGAALGAHTVSLDELLRTADVVTLHVPLLPETAKLIGAPELARMKKDAVLVQASRGGVVDEAALAAALTAGHLGGAAVDVYSTEPPAADNPLLMLTGEAASRLLLTPHIAGVTRQSSALLFSSSWQNVERVLLRGEAPINRAY
jgi:phosphoglycerate dehydrogenase-like enzyme